ncbi:hypothetical protein [Actinomycetospora soli]|uniref:hypothetical protein n=1 Tax=Actinomycetospora soli TaxID=2893887 RepID=UPI001E5E160D|nr:hypothetical protein [Actinomycetospora soli]MCD2191732.1 hypothetical protein [Actinomycetospora soli]
MKWRRPTAAVVLGASLIMAVFFVIALVRSSGSDTSAWLNLAVVLLTSTGMYMILKSSSSR